MRFRTQRDEKRLKVTLGEFEKTRTKQSMKSECDINNIVNRYHKTGVINPDLIREGTYADVSDIGDYQNAQMVVLKARDQFATLPSKVRERFDNDPAKFMEFVHNEQNVEEMIKLGLAVRKPINDDKTTMKAIDQTQKQDENLDKSTQQ